MTQQTKVTIDNIGLAYTRAIRKDGSTLYINSEFLPPDAEEGDILVVSAYTDKRATQRERKEVQSLEDRLFK